MAFASRLLGMDAKELADVAWVRALAISGTLKTVRRAAGLPLKEVAEHLGLHPTTIIRWENGHTTPRASAALAYADVLRRLGQLPGAES